MYQSGIKNAASLTQTGLHQCGGKVSCLYVNLGGNAMPSTLISGGQNNTLDWLRCEQDQSTAACPGQCSSGHTYRYPHARPLRISSDPRGVDHLLSSSHFLPTTSPRRRTYPRQSVRFELEDHSRTLDHLHGRCVLRDHHRQGSACRDLPFDLGRKGWIDGLGVLRHDQNDARHKSQAKSPGMFTIALAVELQLMSSISITPTLRRKLISLRAACPKLPGWSRTIFHRARTRHRRLNPPILRLLRRQPRHPLLLLTSRRLFPARTRVIRSRRKIPTSSEPISTTWEKSLYSMTALYQVLSRLLVTRLQHRCWKHLHLLRPRPQIKWNIQRYPLLTPRTP